MAINQLRRDPLTGRWTVTVMDEVNLQELARGQKSRNHAETLGAISCEYCEGQEKATPPEIVAFRHPNSPPNGPGWRIRVVPEKAPVLQIYGDLNNRGVGIYDVLDGIGAHEVVVEHPKHFVTLPDMTDDNVREILEAYRARIADLKRDTRFRYILVHKNYGEGAGSTNAHSFSHIIATPITPLRVKEELVNAMHYFQFKERCMLCDIVRQELKQQERIIIDDGHFVALSPFAARIPFEVWILPQKHETFFEQNTRYEQLAKTLKQILARLRKVLNDPHYVLVIHSGPNIEAGRFRGYWRTLEQDFHWHIEITPRLRGYTSFEIGSGFNINSIAPERAAVILRDGRLA